MPSAPDDCPLQRLLDRQPHIVLRQRRRSGLRAGQVIRLRDRYDIDERALWPAYQEAYQLALERTSTPDAPWFVVPADKKWFARLAVQQLLLEALRGLDPQWPLADFDPEVQRARLDAS